jgi:hypothetical protein
MTDVSGEPDASVVECSPDVDWELGLEGPETPTMASLVIKEAYRVLDGDYPSSAATWEVLENLQYTYKEIYNANRGAKDISFSPTVHIQFGDNSILEITSTDFREGLPF